MRFLLPLLLVGCGTTSFTGPGDGSVSGDGTSGQDGSSSVDGSADGRVCGPTEIMAPMDAPPGFCPTVTMSMPTYFCDDFGIPSEQLPRPAIGWKEVVDWCSPRAGHRIVASPPRGRVYEAWQEGAGGTDVAYLSHTVMPVPMGYVIVPFSIKIAGNNNGQQITRLVVVRVETNMGPIEGSLWLAGSKIRVHVTGGPAMDVVQTFAAGQWTQVQLKMHVNPGGVDMNATWQGTTVASAANPQLMFSAVNSMSVRIGVVAFEGAGPQTNAIQYNDIYAYGN